LSGPIATDVAAILVDGDLLGHSTHGLQLLAPYLREITAGGMTPAGVPEVVSRRTSAEHWDGRRLPGPWLTLRALGDGRGTCPRARHGDDSDPPLAPHSLSRRLSETRRPTPD
jgi:LDH2 family malate/lactate/ureidoglycolate dehydrogenase